VGQLGSDSIGAAGLLRAWIAEHGIRTLNVAGNPASQAPGIAAFVTAVLERALSASADQRGA
jgi:Circularly permutated YpsA SLOG family